nr:hypothetical protein [Tanacetum cinerariifolium]
DYEAVLYVALQHALVGFVDVLNVNDLNIRHNVVLGAEVEHLLRFGNAANERARHPAALGDEVEGMQMRRLSGHPQQNHSTIEAQQ